MPELLLEKVAKAYPELDTGRTLLAVSGGKDSMSMVHLFAAAGWDFGIAHCNFQLRGADSDQDQTFVKISALHLGVTFHSITFNAEEVAAEKGISIQMAARELRYPWLEAVRVEHKYDFVATAHHLNDNIETSLINQTRGTGLSGLTGMPARRGTLLRPLLKISSRELEAYVEKHGIAFREDSSNAKDIYHRNRIRHHVIPVLQSINPAFENSFQKNLDIWSESAYLMQWACGTLRNQYLQRRDEDLEISFRFLDDHPAAASSLLYEWLKDKGFHLEQLQQAIIAARHSVGAVWYSPTHRLLADREAFLVAPFQPGKEQEVSYILSAAGDQVSLSDGCLKSGLLDKADLNGFSQSEWTAELEATKVTFPLQIRHWREGDVFCPLGMNGRRKKVQDLFTDLKINRFDKEKVWQVVSGLGEIVWIVGYRIDDRFKVTEATKKILKLEFQRD